MTVINLEVISIHPLRWYLIDISSCVRKGTRGGERVSWDEVREWHGHIYTTKCKIDS